MPEDNRIERIAASVFEYLCYMLGIYFGLHAGASLNDPHLAFILIAIAVLFLCSGLSYRARYRDEDRALSNRWLTVGVAGLGLAALPVMVASTGLAVAAAFVVLVGLTMIIGLQLSSAR